MKYGEPVIRRDGQYVVVSSGAIGGGREERAERCVTTVGRGAKLPSESYSYLRASMGSRRAALRAG